MQEVQGILNQTALEPSPASSYPVPSSFADTKGPSGLPWVIAVAAAITLLHMLTNSRYGFHRDELQFLSDARHLDWGFVVYPPLTPLLARIAFTLFGTSLVGFRLFSVLAQAAAIIVTGLMTREVGGSRLAQFTASLVIALTPISIHDGTELIYSSFDYLWWVIAAWFMVRLLNSGNPRWWLGIGAVLGIGLMTKYTIAAFIAGIVAALLFTPLRVYLRSRWLWAGAALATILVLPNAVWQVRNSFISLHWMHSIHLRDLGLGRGNYFLPFQFLICLNILATPLFFLGLSGCLRAPGKFPYFRRYRPLAWMYLTPLALLMLMKAREYYLAPAYPMLVAVGATVAGRWFTTLRRRAQQIFAVTYFGLIAAYAAICIVQIVPLAPDGPLRDFTLAHSFDLREEIGWEELMKTLAAVRDTVPNPAGAAILVGNYGEAGAVELYGSAYHLPPLITGTNSGWLRGYPQSPPSTLIVVGITRAAADGWLQSCRVAARVTNSLGVSNLEDDPIRSSILVCGPPREPWPIFWKQFHSFG